MEEARQILNSCIQKYMEKTEAINTPSTTTWSQWVYEYKIYFTSEYYYVGWFIATAVILGTGYCIYTLVNNSGGSSSGSGKPDGGSGKPGGSSGGSSDGSVRPSGGSGGSNSFDAPSVTDSLQNTISYTVPYQDAASTAAVASILNNIQTKQNKYNTINEQDTTIAKKAVKYKYEGELPANIKLPSFGVDGMMATMMQSSKNVAQKAADKINTLKEKLNDLILEQLLSLKERKNTVVEGGDIISSKLKNGVDISTEGIDAFLDLTEEENINAITRIADTEAEKKAQQLKIKKAIADALMVEKNKSKNEYSKFESNVEQDILTKGINKLIEIQEAAIKLIIDILK